MERRIMRLTWNEYNWHKPSGHLWKKEKQGNNKVAHENQYGYGHEEWLFNPRYEIDGFQYGYIRGVEKAKIKNNTIDELYLYTKAPSGEFYLVGKVLNVQKISAIQLPSRISKLFKKHHKETLEELKAVKADYPELSRYPLRPILKYKIEDAEILDEPIPLNLDKSTYKRFIPYTIKPEVDKELQNKITTSPSLIFLEGKSERQKTYSRVTQKNKKDITSLHVEIAKQLLNYLRKSFPKSKLSLERSNINGKIIDLLEKDKIGEYVFYEIKTNSSALRNIREALGQILEYALLDSSITPKKLVIIGPSSFSKTEAKYFNRLKSNISINLEYWFYDKKKNIFLNQ